MPIKADVIADGIGIVRVVGDVADPGTAKELRDAFDKLIERETKPIIRIAVDLSEAISFAPTGVIAASNQCNKHGGALVVFGAKGAVLDALRAQKLDNVISFFESEYQAVENLKGGNSCL